MSGYGLFAVPTLGMMSQSHALNVIGGNIANITTGGYRRTDTHFATVLSKTLFEQSDLGGVRPRDFQRIDSQGQLVSTQRELDLAINGHGLFALNTEVGGSGQTLYTRDGSFQLATGAETTAAGIPLPDGTPTTITIEEGYLADKNGYFVQGWSPDANGDFSTTGTLSSLRVDPFAFLGTSQATTSGVLSLNLPANATPPPPVTVNEVQDIDVVDSTGALRPSRLDFYKTPTANQWIMVPADSTLLANQVDTVTLAGTVGVLEALDTYSVTVNGTLVTRAIGADPDLATFAANLAVDINAAVGGTVTAAATGSTITLTAVSAGVPFFSSAAAVNGGATADNTVSGPTTTTEAGTRLIFASDGPLSSPSTVNLSLTFGGGGTANVVLDISNMTQFAGPFTPISYSRNGSSSSDLQGITFDSAGHVTGRFADGTFRRIYKLPLAVFTNPDGLEMRDGNTFALTAESGPARVVAADVSGQAEFAPGVHELSNVDLASEFTRMIIVQQAYNSSATVFRTLDEMTQTAAELKR